jgi:serralysin
MATVRLLENSTNMLGLPFSGMGNASGPDFMEWVNGHHQWIWMPGAIVGLQSNPVKTIFIDTNDVTVKFNMQISGLSFHRSATYWNNVYASGNIGALVTDMLGGNDTIFGNSSQETLCGFDGNDVLIGDGHGDMLLGGNGNNTASYQTSTQGGVRASLANPGTNEGVDAAGDQYFSIHNLIGSRFADTLEGDGGGNRLTGGLGRDTLLGRGGPDIFDFNFVTESRPGATRDRLTDFNRANDRIDLKDIDAQTGAGNQAFNFIGTAPFSGAKGQLRFTDNGATVIVQADINGDRRADFEIFVAEPTLSRDDFVL